MRTFYKLFMKICAKRGQGYMQVGPFLPPRHPYAKMFHIRTFSPLSSQNFNYYTASSATKSASKIILMQKKSKIFKILKNPFNIPLKQPTIRIVWS